ncbi:hypothetical protein NA644_04885 [Pseudomonas stutzeri]|uniref:hypothetical protein n=1 Tax=Stutzerimonas stutzeri TaxID=316 RepID=UPI0011AF482A|nr:hypothetical protein [Stutzerimonas stutzeri]MCI0916671.1 hypothetical protein [Stutzerimonas stutzeri]MCQ4248642.1 hypothetical protein [Stutzerimonas stutzeri]
MRILLASPPDRGPLTWPGHSVLRRTEIAKWLHVKMKSIPAKISAALEGFACGLVSQYAALMINCMTNVPSKRVRFADPDQ